MPEKNVLNSVEVSELWLEAATSLGVGLRLSQPATDLWPAHYNLMMLCREQYACETAFARFVEAVEQQEVPRSENLSHPDVMEQILRGYLEIHSFLVSAHVFWHSLKELKNYLAHATIREALVRNGSVINKAKVARDHIEHITERIRKGRSEKFGDPMDPAVFRRAMGNYDKGSVTFGNEVFDLAAIDEAIRRSGRSIAPALRDDFSRRFSVRLVPPTN